MAARRQANENVGDAKEANKYRIALIGVMGSGRSRLVFKLLGLKWFEGAADTTRKLGLETYETQLEVLGETASLEITVIQVEGEDRLHVPRFVNPRLAPMDGFMLVSALTTDDAFSNWTSLQEHLIYIKNSDDVPIVFVATKRDDEHSGGEWGESAKALASRCGVPFVETSAASGYNVEQAFGAIVHEIQKHRRAEAEKPPRSTTKTCSLM